MEESIILMMVLASAICLIGYFGRSSAIAIVGGIGWMVAGLNLLQSEGFPVYLILFFIMVAVAQYYVTASKEGR